MCWMTSTAAGKSPGRSPRIVASAGGPPVEAPKATTGGREALGSACGSAARRARSRARGWVMTRTRLATRRCRQRMSAYCGAPAGTSSAPTTSTAPAAMAASGCSAAAPHTTIGVGAAAMIRSMASRPPPKSSRSTSTVAGRSSLTRSSACWASRANPVMTKPGPATSCSSWRSRTCVPATRTTVTGPGVGGLVGTSIAVTGPPPRDTGGRAMDGRPHLPSHRARRAVP